MLGYLSADIICSGKRTVLRERSLRKTVSFEEQIMFIIVYYPSNLLRNARSFKNWKIYKQLSPFGAKAHSFPRVTLLEGCSLLGTDNVRRQIS